MKTKFIIGMALSTLVGVYMGSVGRRAYDERKLEKESGPETKWSDKTIKEKEAWLRIHEKYLPEGDGFEAGMDVLKKDFYKDILKDMEANED